MNDQTADQTAPESDPESEAQADIQAEFDAEIEAESEEQGDDEAQAPIQFDEPDFEAQIADLKDQVLRAKAEVENTRRIAAREKQDTSKYALTNFARDILRVADNLGFAMMSVSEDARKADQSLDNLYVGIDMTMKELISVFASFNIKPVEAVGKPFDHNFHEAVQQVENADVPANTVMNTLRGGYTLHGRLLRPAQVIVSTGGPKAEVAPVAVQAEPEALQPAPNQTPGQNIDQET